MPGSTSDQSRTGYGDVLKARVPLFGPGTLPPGYHAFPFQAQLPPNLPGSMEFNGHYASR